ncbi:uncharacterized protein LOC106168666 [Lingula anatina]|uniref:Uncharacterized protein LOC106168666 n=1 Tax=Lingula anatina TaxID=7574 RepID=A0A1S3J0E1_LINAN|nr:uncharacterized protein LOC106168666 [Lingula anatina]|eukprot:XP_013403274.1 uncharacterized protein LOC106168666 [Lingula anatina]
MHDQLMQDSGCAHKSGSSLTEVDGQKMNLFKHEFLKWKIKDESKGKPSKLAKQDTCKLQDRIRNEGKAGAHGDDTVAKDGPMENIDSDEYGDETVERLLEHFRRTLDKAGFKTNMCQAEWPQLKKIHAGTS